MLNKIWYPVKGYEGFYEITKDGKVRSLYKHHQHYQMQQRIDRAGYLTVRLTKKDKGSTRTIHRLLALTFIPNPDKKRCVNHKDGNKLNNSLLNLEWCTHSENLKHAYDNGLIKKNKGKHHHEARKLQCLKTGQIFDTIKDAAKKAGVNYNTFRNSLNTNSNREFVKLPS
jgi:hypothetical protein